MTEKEFIKILGTFTPKEMRNFGRFLKGTAERESPNQNALFNYLNNHYPEFSPQKMKREYIATKLFPKAPYPDRTVRDSMSKLRVALEGFIVWKELKEQPEQYDFLRLKAYKRHKLDDSFFKKVDKKEKTWKNKKPQGIEQLYNEYLLKKICFTHPNFSQTNNSSITYEVLIQQLDEYYFAEKLFWTSCLKMTKDFVNISGTDFIEKQHFIQKILNICLNDNSLQNGQVKFLAQVLSVLSTENFQNYPLLEEQFIINVESFDESERNDLIDLLNHISLRDTTVSREESFQRAFELNKLAITEKWILRDEHLSALRFLNIVSIACAVRELEWARHFIGAYGAALDDNVRNDIVSISHAMADFRECLYEEVIDRLLDTTFRKILYEVRERAIRLQCYYELDYSELFFKSFARSFEGLLKRHRGNGLAKNFAQGFLNFIRFARRLMEKRQKFRPNVSSILVDIKSSDNVAYKRWLIEKTEELIKR